MKIGSENKIKPTQGTVTSSYFSSSDIEERVWSSTVNSRSGSTHSHHRQKGQGKVGGWLGLGGEKGTQSPAEAAGTSLAWDLAPGAARSASETVLMIPRRGD